MRVPRLELRAVQKSFGATSALGGVDLTVSAGEIHALIGENGAGKSTLLKLLAGALPLDAGTMWLDGAPYHPKSPKDARRAGVAMVYQELSLCPHLTVAENILLGVEPVRFGCVVRRELERRAAFVLAPIAPALDPRALVGDLSPAEQQIVEIARALAQGVEGSQTSPRTGHGSPAMPRGIAARGQGVLILDEPTSSLDAGDVARLFDVLRGLRDRGVTIVYVSHFLDEVKAISDAYTVIRDGRTTGSGVTANASIPSIVEKMAGRSVGALFPRSPRTTGDVVLETRELAGALKPDRASLSLRRGEVLGIGGLVGAGRTELLRAIFGLDSVRRGTVKVGLYAATGTASPALRLSQGVGLLSEDRKGEGLATELSIAENLTLSSLDRLGPAGVVVRSRQNEAAARWIDKLGIRCEGPLQRTADLSGGNQQKVALGRLLHHDVDVFLLDEPTRGIDVASKAQIYAIIDGLALAGKAVLLVSSQLPELLGVCDRIAVMRRGELGPARSTSDLTEHAVLLEATGT